MLYVSFPDTWIGEVFVLNPCALFRNKFTEDVATKNMSSVSKGEHSPQLEITKKNILSCVWKLD